MSLLKNKIVISTLALTMIGATASLLSTPIHSTVQKQKQTTEFQTLYAKPVQPSSNYASIYLAQGSTGQMVTYLQYGLYINGNNPYGIDGIFGYNTKIAVENFQRSNGLGVDGIVGPQTWQRMQSIILSIQYRAQGLGQNIQADGIAGPATLNAIKNIQRQHGLTPNGMVTGATYNLFFG